MGSKLNIRPTSASLLLIALALLLFFVFTACDDGDEGFRGDPRTENPPENSPEIQPIDPTPDFEPKEGELPGRTHGDRNHGIWPQVWSQHSPNVQSWE